MWLPYEPEVEFIHQIHIDQFCYETEMNSMVPQKSVRYLVIVGTRPEVIKMAPLIREMQRSGHDLFVAHTGQHYSPNMQEIFWRGLGLPNPQFQLQAETPEKAARVDDIMLRIGPVLDQVKPDWVLVHGDTNTTLAAALAAKKRPEIRVAHVEAGLRSFDQSMPEEINRVVVDHIADLLLAPTTDAVENLKREGIAGERTSLVGNTIEDELLLQMYTLGKQNSAPPPYAVLTLHRAENTSNTGRLTEILTSVFESTKHAGLDLLFSVHPRTEKLIRSMELEIPPHVRLLKPLGYVEFLHLMNGAKLIATDSGGLQEEACILGRPCITLRENTERPETVRIGANQLAGVHRDGIFNAFERALNSPIQWKSPYGGGLASRQILNALQLENSRTRLAEVKALNPDVTVLGVEAEVAALFKRSHIV